VVDFADISREFKATNEAYFRELTQELGDEVKNYSQLFKSENEIVEGIEEIKDTLWEFDTQNIENFSKQISKISNIKEMRRLKKALENSKNIYNLIRLFGYEKLLDKLHFKKLNILYLEVINRLNLLNLKEKSENSSDSSNLINEALEDTIFLFEKIGEEELLLADRLKRKLRKTREEFIANFDKKDPEYIKLKSELERLFKKGKIGEVGQEAMGKNIAILNKILEKIRELNQKNERLSQKYREDNKYVRIHKRLAEKNILSKPQNRLFQALNGIKEVVDDDILKNSKLLDNENYFEKNMLRLIIQELKRKQKIKLDTTSAKYINNLVVREYINEYNGTYK
jgi:type I restriction enzyme R subunit